MQLLRAQIVPHLEAALLASMPDWQIPILGHNVLIDDRIHLTFDDCLRPHQVVTFVAGMGAVFTPLHVQDISVQVEQLMPYAPLYG